MPNHIWYIKFYVISYMKIAQERLFIIVFVISYMTSQHRLWYHIWYHSFWYDIIRARKAKNAIIYDIICNIIVFTYDIIHDIMYIMYDIIHDIHDPRDSQGLFTVPGTLPRDFRAYDIMYDIIVCDIIYDIMPRVYDIIYMPWYMISYMIS